MKNNALAVVESEKSGASTRTATRLSRQQEQRAKFERLWLQNPEQFNPMRSCMHIERLERSWTLLLSHGDIHSKRIADIGCGEGTFSRRLKEAGATVEAVDIAENALRCFRQAGADGITLIRDGMPDTSLSSHQFDIVVSTDLIAYLSKDDHRLFFAELSRLLKPEGVLLCSTPIDIYSEGGMERLLELAQTEFDILQLFPSYYALYLRLKGVFDFPTTRLNNGKMGKPLWKCLQFLFSPFVSLLKKNRRLMLGLEKICRFCSDQSGISHVIFLAKRRELKKVNPEDIPVEPLKKREVWT